MEGKVVHKGTSAIVVVLIGLLGIIGCGDDSSLSKAEYEQELELVCNEGQKTREEFVADVNRRYEKQQKKPTAAEQRENLRDLMGVLDATTDEIADIGLPEQDEKKAEELVKAREVATAKVKADPEGALQEFPAIFGKAYRLAEDFDAASCAR
jgi:hypothetical protein